MSETEPTPVVTTEEIKAAIHNGVLADLANFMPRFQPDRTESAKARQSIAELPAGISPFIQKQLENSVKEIEAREDKALKTNVAAFLRETYDELESVFAAHGLRVRKSRSAAVPASAEAEAAAVA